MKDISIERLTKDIHRALENPFWLTELEIDTDYVRIHDDHDGEFNGRLAVSIDKMGDVWVGIDDRQPIRFRTFGGGGQSQRTRSALLILALAVKLDNEKRPQQIPGGS